MISIDDFKKIEIKIGQILSAEKIPETDKLLKLSVDFGLKLQSSSLDLNNLVEKDIRQIISGVASYFPNPESLIGKKCAFVTNLEWRKIKGLESQGMILAVLSGQEETKNFSLLEVDSNILPGSRIN
ncbi:MAG: methionine--tRNA ligase [Minisyncoccia bacterium]